MADKKQTLATMRKLLAKRAGISEGKATNFLEVFFQTIVEGLQDDGQVRLSGLGTLKVQTMKPRKSVNVTTGETIIIDSYNKVVFVADVALHEKANVDYSSKPTEHSTTGIVSSTLSTPIVGGAIDPLKKLGEQAEEIKDLLAELGSELPSDLPQEDQQTKEGEQAKEVDVVPIVVAEQKEEVEQQDAEKGRENAEVGEKKIEEENQPTENENKSPEKVENSEVKPTKGTGFQAWKVAGITVLIFCLLLVGAYFFLKHKIVSWADNLVNQTTEVVVGNKTQVEEYFEQEQSFDNTEISEYTENINSPESLENFDQSNNSYNPWFGDSREYVDFIKTETLNEGSRLTHLSRKYYGAPDFWVYIYEANQSRIPNPNKIGVGTKLRIPKLPQELIDINNQQAMQQAAQLQEQILGKK